MFSKLVIVTLFLQTLVLSLQLENSDSVHLTTIAKTSAVSDYSTGSVTVYQIGSLESDQAFVKHDKRLLVTPNDETTSTTTSFSTTTSLSSTYTNPVLEDFKKYFQLEGYIKPSIVNGQAIYEINLYDEFIPGFLLEAVAAPGTSFSLNDYSFLGTDANPIRPNYENSTSEILYMNYLDKEFDFMLDKITIVSNISTPAPSTIKQQLVFYASPAVYYKRDTSLVKAVLDLTVGETTYDFTSIELVNEAPSVADIIASAALEDSTTTSIISTTTSLNTSIAVSVTSTSLNFTTGAAASITASLNTTATVNSTSTAIAAVFTNSSTSIISGTSSSSIVTPLDTTSASPVASADPTVANTISSLSTSVASNLSIIPTSTIQYLSSNVPIYSSTNSSAESTSNSVDEVTTTNVYGSTIVVNANGDSQSSSSTSSMYEIYTTDKSTTSCYTSVDENGMSTVVTMMTSVWETITCTETKCLYQSDKPVSTTDYTLEVSKSTHSSFTKSGVSTESISIATHSVVSSAENKAFAMRISGLSSLLGLLIMFI